MQAVRIEEILGSIAKNDSISDIHIASNEFLTFRKNGDIVKYTKLPKISEDNMETIIKQLLKGNMKAYERFLKERELDCSYVANDTTPYRVNAYFKLGKIGAVLRKINAVAKNLDDLMFPDMAKSLKDNVLGQRQGMFLVTGPTGSGKSTTLVAMLEHINHNRPDHIITIEDPIEFIFTPDQALITQREIGHDSWNFPNSLRGAMRQDPDIVLVGEIRDTQTAEAALNLAETGHMVFSTLHTQSASGTVNRYISFFPPEIQDSVADRLADSLLGVLSQRLVKTKDGKSRVGAYEVLINTSAVKNNIKRRQLPQIDNILETGTKQGMITLPQYAKRLVTEGATKEEYVSWIFSVKK